MTTRWPKQKSPPSSQCLPSVPNASQLASPLATTFLERASSTSHAGWPSRRSQSTRKRPALPSTTEAPSQPPAITIGVREPVRSSSTITRPSGFAQATRWPPSTPAWAIPFATVARVAEAPAAHTSIANTPPSAASLLIAAPNRAEAPELRLPRIEVRRRAGRPGGFSRVPCRFASSSPTPTRTRMCGTSSTRPRTARPQAANAPSSRPASGRTCSRRRSTRSRSRPPPSSRPGALPAPQPQQPALVIAGDDRAARDLAADLKQFLSPRPVRFYPARGVRYESHLAPPPHLVGLRVAALDALATSAAVVVASAAALAEKVPDPELRPHGFTIEKGGMIDLEETADKLVACGYERVDQVEDRGQFAIRGDILDVYPATEERAVRCELFDIEVERLTFFSTFTQRSLEEADHVEIAPAAEIGPEHRELAEMAALEEAGQRPDVAEVLPVDRFCDVLS